VIDVRRGRGNLWSNGIYLRFAGVVVDPGDGGEGLK